MEATLPQAQSAAPVSRVRTVAQLLYKLTAAFFFVYLFYYYWTAEGGPALLALALVPVTFVLYVLDEMRKGELYPSLARGLSTAIGAAYIAVSIAVAHEKELQHGVVYDPLRQEIFSASRGQGAQLEGRKIRVSKLTTLRHALVATGFPYRLAEEHVDVYLQMLRAVMIETAGVRRPGSAALDLCYVAAGRVDGFWELGLKKWDIAAGALIIREAGGRISDFQGSDAYLESGSVVAGTPKVYAALSKLLAPYARKAAL